MHRFSSTPIIIFNNISELLSKSITIKSLAILLICMKYIIKMFFYCIMIYTTVFLKDAVYNAVYLGEAP